MNQGMRWTPTTLRKRRHNSFFMEGRTMSIKCLFTYLLLQVACALNHVRMQQPHKICYKNKIYAKVMLNHSFISIEENYRSYGQQPMFQIHCIPSGMCPLTFCRKEAMPIHGLVWIFELKPNHHFSNGTKEMSATKRIYNKTTHS